MYSTRFVPAICLLLALALVPTGIHSYAGLTLQDGHRATALSPTLDGFTSKPTARTAGWGKKFFLSDDWVERRYVRDRDEVTLLVTRSFDPKRLYHHPEIDVMRGVDFSKSSTRALTIRPDRPVTILEAEGSGGRTVALYALLYEDRFVSDPVWFQVRTSTKLLFSGQRAMTLFFASQRSVPEGAVADTLPAARVLLAAIDDFMAQRVGGPK